MNVSSRLKISVLTAPRIVRIVPKNFRSRECPVLS